MKKLTKRVLNVMLVVGLISYASASGSKDNSQYINESFRSDISRIDIDSISYPLFIETHDSEEILVEIDIKNSNYEDPFTVEISGDTLEIIQIQTSQNTSTLNIFGLRFGSESGTGSIVVKVPVNSKYDYDIDDGDADIHIATINANNIDVSTRDGDIKAEKIFSQENIVFRTNGGDINLYDVNLANPSRIDVNTGSGAIRAEKVSGHMTFNGGGGIDLHDINSANGILTVFGGGGNQTLDTVNAKNIYVSTGSGRIKLEQIICTDINIESNNMVRPSGDIKFSGLNAQNITIDSSHDSNVRGSIIGKQSDFSVTSHTDSGSNNLSNQAGSGSKTLNVSTYLGNIDISFTE